MKVAKFSLFACLLCAAASSFADWQRTNIEDDYQLYIDLSTARRQGGKVKVWEMTDFAKIQTRGGWTYLSTRYQEEYDCVNETRRIMYIVAYDGKMGGGNVVTTDPEPDPPRPIVPESHAQTAFNLVCRNK